MAALPGHPEPYSTAFIARVGNALTGGRLADRPAREAAALLAARIPGIRERQMAARRFHSDAALRAVTGWGAAGVIFAGGGLPCDPDPHTAALAADPRARFVYADPDPGVSAVNRAVLDSGQVSAVRRGLRDPGALLAAGPVRSMAAAGPVMLQMQLRAQFWTGPEAAGLIGEYARLLPSGSLVCLSLGIPEPGPAGEKFTAVYEELTGAAVYAHTPAQIAGWLTGAGMTVIVPGDRVPDTPESGVMDVRAWADRSWADPELRRKPAGRIVGAVARIP